MPASRDTETEAAMSLALEYVIAIQLRDAKVSAITVDSALTTASANVTLHTVVQHASYSVHRTLAILLRSALGMETAMRLLSVNVRYGIKVRRANVSQIGSSQPQPYSPVA